MNLLKNKLAGKLMLVAMMLLGAGNLFAANKIYFASETVNISNGSTIDIPVMMDCDENATAVQFNVTPSAGLSVVSVTVNPDRLAGHIHNYVAANRDLMVYSTSNRSFRNSTGLFATIRVQANSLTAAGVELKLENIIIGGKDGNNLVDGGTATVKVVPGATSRLYSVEALSVTPGGTATVSLGLNNPVEVRDFTFRITLPEGFSFMTNSDNMIEASHQNVERLTENTSALGRPKGNTVLMVVYNPFGPTVTGTTGDILTFDVKVPETIAENSVIKFSEFTIGQVVGDELTGEGCEIKLIDGKAVADKALAEVAALEKSLADSIAKIETACPDVKDNFKGEAIAAEIAKLKAAVEAADKAGSLATDYEKVMEPKAAIEASIAKLVADAEAAQKALVDNKAAFDAATASIAALRDALKAAGDTIAEKCPLVVENFKVDALAAKIDQLEAAVNAANEDKTIAAKAEEFGKTAEALNLEIKAFVEEAKLAQAEAQAEIDRKNKNQAAYEADKQIIDELTKALEDVIAEIKDFDNVEDFDQDKLQIYREISNLNKAVESKFEDVAEKGEYKSQIASIDQAAIKGMIDSYKKKALNKENQRKADNQAAYDADLADIKTVEDSYNTVKNGIQSDWTNTFPEDQAAIDAAIDALKQKAGDELARVADNGTYVDQIDQNALDAVQAKINAYNEKLQTSGIGSIIADEDLQNVRIYTIDGVRHNSLVPGVNIIVKADGTTTKVYVK